MPQFVSEGAEDLLDSPSDHDVVELIVRVQKEDLDAAESWVRGHSGEIVESLEHGLLEITLPATHVGELCEQQYVLSVERADETIGVLDQGN